MAITKLNPYLTFNGDAERALKLYERVLGAKTEGLMRFGEHAEACQGDPSAKDRVLHAELRMGESVIMASDTQPGQSVASGGNVQVVLHFDDASDMAKRFEALAAGGKVLMPLEDMFWGAKFGMLVDAFGISWMFNCDLKKS